MKELKRCTTLRSVWACEWFGDCSWGAVPSLWINIFKPRPRTKSVNTADFSCRFTLNRLKYSFMHWNSYQHGLWTKFCSMRMKTEIKKIFQSISCRVCVAQDCIIPTIDNGNMVHDDKTVLNPGDTINPRAGFTISCQDQYQLDSVNARVECVTLNIFNPETLPQCLGEYFREGWEWQSYKYTVKHLFSVPPSVILPLFLPGLTLFSFPSNTEFVSKSI